MGFARLAIILCLAAGCSTGPAPIPDPPPQPDACQAACERLAALGCPEAEPTPEGASCDTVCRNVEESGVTSMRPGCVAEANSCEEADSCTSWEAQ